MKYQTNRQQRDVVKLREKEQVSKVREKIKSDTEGREFIKLQNEESTEVENVEILGVSIEKESGENEQDSQQIEAPESGKLEVPVLEISVCETSDGQDTDASDVEKVATTEDSKIPEIRIEDFCDAPEVEGGSQGDEENIKQNLQEDQVFRDLCEMRLAGYYNLILVLLVNQRFVQDAFGWMLKSQFSVACKPGIQRFVLDAFNWML